MKAPTGEHQSGNPMHSASRAFRFSPIQPHGTPQNIPNNMVGFGLGVNQAAGPTSNKHDESE